MELKFMNEKKQQDELYKADGDKIQLEIENLKKQNTELEAAKKLRDSEYEKESSLLKE